MHFLVGDVGFLESSDEVCDFIKIVTLETGGIKRARGLIIRFHNSLWSSDFWALDPGIFLWGGGSSKCLICVIHVALVASVTDSEAF